MCLIGPFQITVFTSFFNFMAILLCMKCTKYCLIHIWRIGGNESLFICQGCLWMNKDKFIDCLPQIWMRITWTASLCGASAISIAKICCYWNVWYWYIDGTYIAIYQYSRYVDVFYNTPKMLHLWRHNVYIVWLWCGCYMQMLVYICQFIHVEYIVLW